MDAQVRQLAEKVLAGGLLDRAGAMRLADVQGDGLYDLFYWANRVRLQFIGRGITFCSIAAARLGACSEDCKFCAQSARHKTNVAPARLSEAQILQAADQAAAGGAEAFGIVNSGRRPTEKDLDWLAAPIERISQAGRVRCCAALGSLTPAQAQRLARMGVRCYNHNLETSERFFPSIVTTHPFSERVATARAIKAAGLMLCCGGIFNLGETWEDRIDLALAVRDLGADVVPLNFLHPISGTPLADRPPMHPMEILKVLALFRLLLPTRQIKLAGGREINLRDLQSWMFYCGASSTMIGNYLTTCGRPADQDRQLVADLGLEWARPEGQGTAS